MLQPFPRPNKSETPAPHAAHLSQQGSVIIPMVGIIFVGLVLLGSVQLGYLFYMKRELQNAADNAAQSGALELALTHCSRAQDVAAEIVTRDLGNTALDKVEVECGLWNDQAATEDTAFSSGGATPNAIKVQLRHRLASMVPFMEDNQLSAVAIAAQKNGGTAVFSIGSTLLSLDSEKNGLLPTLLEEVGLDPSINVLSPNGLSNIKLTPAGLLQELGIEVPATITLASLHQLLNTEAQVFALTTIIDASIKLIEHGDAFKKLAPNDQQILKNIQHALALAPSSDTLVHLFGTSSSPYPYLFAIPDQNYQLNGADPKQSAGLNTAVGIEQILGLGLAISTQKKALDVGLNLELPLLKANVDVGVIEPPTIVIGGNGTQAHSANIRAFIDVCIGVGCTLTSNLLNLTIKLPLVLEVMNATGTIQNICPSEQNSQLKLADIAIQSEVAALCIGNFSLDSTDADLHPFSYTNSCTQNIPLDNASSKYDVEIAKASLLGILDLSVKNSMGISALKSTGMVSFTDADSSNNNGPPYTVVFNTDPLNNLGSTVDHLTDVILYQLLASLLSSDQLKSNNLSSSQSTQLINEMVQSHWTKAAEIEDCNATPNDLIGSHCRKKILDRSIASIQEEVNSLDNYLMRLRSNSLLGNLGGTVGNLLGLNLPGVITGLIKTVGSLLESVLGGLVGINTSKYLCNGTGGILGVIGLGDFGSVNGCINTLKSSIQDQNASSYQSNPDLLPLQSLHVVKKILETLHLEELLNTLGSNLLTPLVKNILGADIGKVDATLHNIDCKPDVRLVY